MGFHPGTMEKAVIASVRNAEWITPADEAWKWLTRRAHREIDNLDRQGRLDGMPLAFDPMVAELARTCLSLLRDGGLTPGARRRLGLGEASDDDGLSATITRLRAAQAGNAED